ncbi:MAG TPA: hypothetical protein VEC96_02485, partial [Anaerolineae bacterium]|nr:hypothetical protein [Anaerolineae bacterium]
MEISRVWLQAHKNHVSVLVEVAGKWYKVIYTCCAGGESEISHCVNVENELPSDAFEVEFDLKEYEG